MKNLEYFMTLPYRIEIRPIPEKKGGGYEASIPELGRYAVRADGETIEEALNNLQGIKEERLAAYLEEGLSIPEPDRDEEDYSGKFVLRIPKSLHRELSHRAKLNNVSLNQFTTAVLSSGLAIDRFHSAIQSLQHDVKDLQQRVRATAQHDFRTCSEAESSSTTGSQTVNTVPDSSDCTEIEPL